MVSGYLSKRHCTGLPLRRSRPENFYRKAVLKTLIRCRAEACEFNENNTSFCYFSLNFAKFLRVFFLRISC